MERDLRKTAAQLATAGIAVDLSDFWRFPVTPFDPELVGRVRTAARTHSSTFSDIVSGAGHDASTWRGWCRPR